MPAFASPVLAWLNQGALEVPTYAFCSADEAQAVERVRSAMYAVRAGPSSVTDLYLADASTGTAIPDTIAGEYSGGFGSTKLVPDYFSNDGVAVWVGDVVGTPHFFDVVGVQGLVAVGVPADYRDAGLGPCSASDYVPGFALPDLAALSVAIKASRPSLASGSQALVWASTDGVTGAPYIAFEASTAYVELGTLAALRLDISAVSVGDPVVVVWTLDDDAGLAGESTLAAMAFDGSGTLLDTDSATMTTSSIVRDHDCNVGQKATPTAPDAYSGSGLRVLVFDGVLDTSAAASVADGSDESGGDTLVADWRGLRSGVHSPADLSLLPIAAGAGTEPVKIYLPGQFRPIRPRPQRAGTNNSLDQYVVDGTTGLQVPDDGAGLYNETSGSWGLAVDPVGPDGSPIELGDNVGSAWVLDAVSNQAIGTTIGIPVALGGSNGVRGVAGQARMYFSDTDYVQWAAGLQASDFASGCVTVVMSFINIGTTSFTFIASTPDASQGPNAGISMGGIRILVPTYSTLYVFLGGLKVHTSRMYAGKAYTLVASYSETAIRGWMFDGANLLGSNTGSGSATLMSNIFAAEYLIGANPNAAGVGSHRVNEIRFHDLEVTTEAEARALMNAVDRGASTLRVDPIGVRTGIRREFEPEDQLQPLLYGNTGGANLLTVQEY